jgi:hypothetical protein
MKEGTACVLACKAACVETELECACVMQAIDATRNCWAFSLYWMDIIGLALQQAGGKPGPAAVPAAQQLMKEKHSIFVAR